MFNYPKQSKKLKDFYNSLIIAITSNLFSLIYIRVIHYENAYSNLLEIPLIIGLFYLRNPLYLFLICALSFINTVFVLDNLEIYLPTVVLHLIPLFATWFIYQWLKKKELGIKNLGLIWILIICLYYYALILPSFITTYYIFGLKGMPFTEYYHYLFKATKFEVVATALVTSLYLIQLEVRNSLEHSNKKLKKKEKELNILNQSLLQTTEDLDNFIYTASHELRTPISNIEGSVYLLKDESEGAAERQKIYTMMFTSINKFKETIESLIEISQVQQLREHEFSLIKIEDLINQVMTDHAKELKKINAQVDTDFSKCPNIQFPLKNLKRIIENLINNAIKFRKEDQPLKIQIRTEENNEYYILSIKDNGMGIKTDYQNKIFTMFKKAHANRVGKGIGLYIVKRILEKDGGKIKVESKENEGSCFTIFFNKSLQTSISHPV